MKNTNARDVAPYSDRRIDTPERGLILDCCSSKTYFSDASARKTGLDSLAGSALGEGRRVAGFGGNYELARSNSPSWRRDSQRSFYLPQEEHPAGLACGGEPRNPLTGSGLMGWRSGRRCPSSSKTGMNSTYDRWVQSHPGGWSPALHSFGIPGKVLAYVARAPDLRCEFW